MCAQDDVVHRKDGVVVAGRFDFKHVEAGVGDPLFFQRLDQRCFLHRWATAGVDEDRGLLHLLEMLLAEHALDLGARGRVHRNEVGLRQYFLERARDYAVLDHDQFLDERVIGDDLQAERLGALGDGARDVTEGDQAKRLAHQARDRQQSRAAFAPFAFAHHLVLLDGAAERRQQ